MKKIALMALTVIAFTFASCGNKTANNTTATDSDSVAVLSDTAQATVNNLTGELQKALNAKDSQGTIVSLANLETIYKNLVDAGKLDEAKTYGTAIKEFINNNAETIKTVAAGNTTIASLVEGIKNLPTTATATAEEAKSAVATDVVNLASPTIAKGVTAVATAEAAAEAVKNAPATVKEAATAAANTAVESAKTAAENKANEAVTNAQNKANEEVNKAAEKANKKVNEATSKALKGLGL